jgi:hypothetical protein
VSPSGVDPKAVRRLLAEAIAPPMRAQGFTRARGTHLGWFRERGAGMFECVFFPLGKYGWSERTGGTFDAQLQVGDAIHPFARAARRAWFSARAPEQDLAEAWRINDAVARSLPEPYFESSAWEALDVATRTAAIDWTRYDARVRCRPYQAGEHVGFHYYTQAHVEAWAAYFAGHLGPVACSYFDEASAR